MSCTYSHRPFLLGTGRGPAVPCSVPNGVSCLKVHPRSSPCVLWHPASLAVRRCSIIQSQLWTQQNALQSHVPLPNQSTNCYSSSRDHPLRSAPNLVWNEGGHKRKKSSRNQRKRVKKMKAQEKVVDWLQRTPHNAENKGSSRLRRLLCSNFEQVLR